MKSSLRRVTRKFLKSALESVLAIAEGLTGFRTARGDYLPNRLRILLGIYEAEELRLMRQFLRPGQLIVDVGANVGYLTRFFARSSGQSGKVCAFEPNPLIFSLLERNVASLPQVEAYNFGLSTQEEERPLFLAGSDHSVASFSRDYPLTHVFYQESGQLNSVTARLVAGDEFMRKIGPSRTGIIDKIDILKVDVEGWELNVLAGLEKTIMSSKKITIFCEYNPSAQECAGWKSRELLEWFLDRQFALSYPDKGELRALSPASIDRLADALEPKGYTTIFAQRR
jgi:FkbM family methyltransferase